MKTSFLVSLLQKAFFGLKWHLLNHAVQIHYSKTETEGLCAQKPDY